MTIFAAHLNDLRAGKIDLDRAVALAKSRSQDLNCIIDHIKFEAGFEGSARAFFLLVETYANMGDQLLADATAALADKRGHQLHISHYINCGVDKLFALADDEKKLLYFPIPKCGSSTIKNYFTFCTKGKTYGAFVHFNHNEMNRYLTTRDVEKDYNDYFKFSVVRDPISRIASYYQKNIEGGALRRDALGERVIYGLDTIPGPRYCADKFSDYRQLFLDFRHHTDPMRGYIGTIINRLDRIYQMNEIDEIRELISKAYKKPIEDERAMETTKSKFDSTTVKGAFSKLEEAYSADYQMMEAIARL